MKSINIKFIAAILLVVVAFSGCGLKKMTKKYQTVKYEVTPEVLETHGGKISVTVKGTLPEKYFNKKAVIVFAPVLKYANGTTPLKAITLQGEKVTGEGTIIKKKEGGTFTYTDVITYTPDMNKSELVVNATAKLGEKKTAELGERKLVDGVIYTSTRIEKEGDVLLAEDGYQKETILSQNASIFFAKALSDLNLKLGLNKDTTNARELKNFLDFLKKEWKIKNIDINAWASPEGEETYNAGLSEKRSKTAEKFIQDKIIEFAKAKAKAAKIKVNEKELKAALPTAMLTAKGADWDGFLQALTNSSIKEKASILNVINSQADPLKKEKEINNMTVIYPEIENAILPTLRRSNITINYYEPKKTDEQMAKLAITTPDSLKKEELLYAATLTEDLNTKLKIYDAATKVYANDWKGYNNAGYVCLKLGKIEEAANYLNKANSLMPNNGIITNNLGVVALWKKDWDNAKSIFETAKGLGIDENFNMAPLSIKDGNYSGAIAAYGSRTCTHNLALAQLLSGNSSAAATTLDCTKKSAAVYYLLAVVGARTGNTALIYENLPKAITLDASYRDQAKDDREFLKFNASADFLNAIK